MTDVLNTPLHDGDLLAEIEIATELMIVASESEGPLCQRTIDTVLRVQPSARVSRTS